ncbi:unnamed protein product [Moneuplotes crassus]|uniref:Uncharacterized protein n=2 Tax=Euplotes crassus TaxID=5936 RepID=A0AAD1XR37_EUPCR|nr:unnamed protein product [Moneuplotes crassus]
MDMDQREEIKLDDLRPDIEESSADAAGMEEDENTYLKQKQMVDAFTKTISSRTIARTIIPKLSVLKKALQMQNILFLLEKILDELCNMCYYNSVVSLMAWIIGLLVFFAYPTGMGLIWLHVFHIPRGVFGLFLCFKKLPNVHSLIEEIGEFDEREKEEQWKFEKIANHLKDNFKNYVIKSAKSAQKFLFIYFILSAICAVFDTIGMFIQVIMFGTKDNVYEPIFMIALISVLMATNLSYFLYIGSFVYRIPGKFRKEVLKITMGQGNQLVERVTNSLKKNKNNEEAKNGFRK